MSRHHRLRRISPSSSHRRCSAAVLLFLLLLHLVAESSGLQDRNNRRRRRRHNNNNGGGGSVERSLPLWHLERSRRRYNQSERERGSRNMIDSGFAASTPHHNTHTAHRIKERIHVVESDGDDEDVDESHMLNVSREDSPYALINVFFPNREVNHRRMENAFEKEYVNGGLNGEQTVSIGELQPEDIWMSEGKLLVLKGSSSATSRQGYYDPWEPLDDYQAPYREPKLPPHDFVPEEHGVGVPLPPESHENDVFDEDDFGGGGVEYVYPGDDDEDEETNEISDNLNHALRHPGFLPAPPPPTTKAPSPKPRFDFDRKIRFNDKYVSEMERFQRKLRSQIHREDDQKRFLLKTTAPDHYSYNYVSTSTPRPATTTALPLAEKPAPTFGPYFPVAPPVVSVTPKSLPPLRNYVTINRPATSPRPSYIEKEVKKTTRKPEFTYKRTTNSARSFSARQNYSTRRSTTVATTLPPPTTTTTTRTAVPPTPTPYPTPPPAPPLAIIPEHNLRQQHFDPNPFVQGHATSPRSYFLQNSWATQQHEKQSHEQRLRDQRYDVVETTTPQPQTQPPARARPSPSPLFISAYKRRQKELAVLSNEIEDEGHLGRARRKQHALSSPSTQSVRYLEYNKSRGGKKKKEKENKYFTTARRNYAVNNPKPSEVRSLPTPPQQLRIQRYHAVDAGAGARNGRQFPPAKSLQQHLQEQRAVLPPPPPPPPLAYAPQINNIDASSGAARRNGHFQSFFRGGIGGGRSWGYSYRLKRRKKK